LFFLDDHFLEAYMRPRNLAGGKAYLARLAEFMTERSDGAPRPADPVERALADLWSRTMSGATADWRRRFRDSTEGVLDEHLRELPLFSRHQVPDPISYQDLRREGRAGPWSAALVELALSVPLPPAISATQPIRDLQDALGDTLRLHNDITSYHREAAEGEVNNQVMVVQRFLGCDTQKATGIVQDLLVSRSQRFEEIVATDLPVLFAEHRLGATARPRYCAMSRACTIS
jgi:germacradienol/geosmin synthase